MAGPAAPSVASSASASAASSKELAFPLPPSSLQAVEKKIAAGQSAAAASSSEPTEQVLAPARGTLAAGRYEARPVTIWLVVAVGTLLGLVWAFARVRRARLARRRELDALASLRKPRA